MRAGILFSLCLCVFLAADRSFAQTSTDLEAVLQRATEYVAQYEGDLGNLIGAEEYTQNASWISPQNRLSITRRERRRLSSDFLIIQVGTEWVALRKVTSMDGFKEKQTEPSFDDAFDTSPGANAKRLEGMKTESTRYNIGDIRRDINLPTFALKVLRKSEVSRFSKTQKEGGM